MFTIFIHDCHNLNYMNTINNHNFDKKENENNKYNNIKIQKTFFLLQLSNET